MAQFIYMTIARTQSFLILAAALAFAAAIIFTNSTPFAYAQYCTQDAMQCPDGSWVGRTGPNCSFVCPPGNGTIAPPVGTVDPSNPIIKDLVPLPAGSGEIAPPGASGGSSGYPEYVEGTIAPEIPVINQPSTQPQGYWDRWINWWNGNGSAQVDTAICPSDAMQCPDGTVVGRTGPNCSFVCPDTNVQEAPRPGTLPSWKDNPFGDNPYAETNYPGIEHPGETTDNFFGTIGNWFSGLFSWFRW